MGKVSFQIVLVIWMLQTLLCCNRIPLGTKVPKSPVDENYVLSINGNSETYIPRTKYNVSLTALNGLTFISFMISLEPEDNNDPEFHNLGYFEINDIAESRFSSRCPNAIENTNTNIKTHVDVIWTAPADIGSGCILLRAMIAQHRDVWFRDDGFLTKRICEEEVDDIDNQPSVVDPCCACDEAKYELTFEGKWSRHTHPKDFPANSWRTRFSDIMGASHTINYQFWQYGKLASDGLREIAEHGSTRTLESELKENSDQIRTIIKARGIAYPNVTGKTFAVFRVDSQHHLISLVSMIDPSPDWIVGVSGLELCLPNCSWVESKTHNLYPWDAGTDSGASYMSADQPQVPPDVIRRIRSNFPNDPRSPFYEPAGVPMKPLATLYINRRRLYEKTCENVEMEDSSVECMTLPWSEWSECNTKCGQGKQYRTREFRNSTSARISKCRNTLLDEQNCIGRQCNSNTDEMSNTNSREPEYPGMGLENPECAISDWGEWSTCSATCGSGVIIRSRHYLNPRAKKKCQKVSRVKLQETKECRGIACGGEIEHELEKANENNENLENSDTKSLYNGRHEMFSINNFESYSQKREDFIPIECQVSHWSDFSPCMGPCGTIGKRYRERKVWNNDDVYEIRSSKVNNRTDPCGHISLIETVNCTNPSCDSIVLSYCYANLVVSPCRDNTVNNFWFYDFVSNQCSLFWADKCDKNENKFTSKEACEEVCLKPRQKQDILKQKIRPNIFPLDCIFSDWKVHSCNATCGEGIQVKTRRILRSPKYGGKPCPKHLVRIEKCYQYCDKVYSINNAYRSPTQLGGYNSKQTQENGKCQYSEWSAWTPCTTSCGENSIRQRTRTLLNNELSYMCKDRLRLEKCTMNSCYFTEVNEK